MSKFRYPIFPDRLYTLTYGDAEIEVLGEDILLMFRKGYYFDIKLNDLSKETKFSTETHISEDLNTPDF